MISLLIGYTATESCQHRQLVPLFLLVGALCDKRSAIQTVFTSVRKHYFCNRIVKVWNDLPSDTDFTSIGTFRSTLARFNVLVYCDKD